MSHVVLKLTHLEARNLYLMAMAEADDIEEHFDNGRDIAAFDRAIDKLQSARYVAGSPAQSV